MFSKIYEYRPDDAEVQGNLERIRQAMMASASPVSADVGVDDKSLADVEVGEPAGIVLEVPDYGSTDQNRSAAITAGRQIAERSSQAEGEGVLSSLSGAARTWLRWYTGPLESYWETVTTGLDHVVASLKAHDAEMQKHAEAVRKLQQEFSGVIGQLQGARATMQAHSSSLSGDAGHAGSTQG